MPMFLGGPQKSPTEVFTPRSAEVNTTMYIDRPELESKLAQAIQGHLHVLIHGESGCGKSWLYKRILAKLDAFYIPLNLAVASNYNSIASAMQAAVDRYQEPTKVAFTEMKSAEIGIPGLKGELEHTGTYEIAAREPFEACLHKCRAKAGDRMAFLVLDNLESVFSSPSLMSELGNLITLLDDENYSKHKVRMIIVGVPAEVKHYFSNQANRQTIANRLKEIPEVSALNGGQVQEFVERGFIKELACSIDGITLEYTVGHVYWVTLGIPQRLHEYCLELAQIAEIAGRSITRPMLDEADRNWLESQMSNDYTMIQAIMNERETKVGRRNQVLYAIGKVSRIEFRISDIETLVREDFSESTKDRSLNIGQILSELSKESTKRPNPIIKRSSSKSDAYIFRDPRFKMCIRAMLRKDDATGQVNYVDILDAR